jgi:hypothetical protein
MDLIKLKIEQIKEMGRGTALIPVNDIEYDMYKKIKINEVLKAKIKKYREYHTHKHYFKMLHKAVDNGILEKELTVGHGEDTTMTIKMEVINSIIVENGNDKVEALRYMVQVLFLPGEIKTNPDGTRQKVRGSIEYSKLDEIEFTKYKSKVARFLADNLDCDVWEIEKTE